MKLITVQHHQAFKLQRTLLNVPNELRTDVFDTLHYLLELFPLKSDKANNSEFFNSSTLKERECRRIISLMAESIASTLYLTHNARGEVKTMYERQYNLIRFALCEMLQINAYGPTILAFVNNVTLHVVRPFNVDEVYSALLKEVAAKPLLAEFIDPSAIQIEGPTR